MSKSSRFYKSRFLAALLPKKHESELAVADPAVDPEVETVAEPLDQEREEEVKKSLSAIYQDESGQMPDLTKIERVKSKRGFWTWLTVALGALLTATVIWAGISFFKPFRGFSGDALALEIQGPENISLGQEVAFLINYENRSSEPIAAAELRISFPTDFVSTRVEPPPTGENLTWRLGSLASGEKGTIRISGNFTGALGTVTAIQVVGTYRPASFSSDFENLATKVLNYNESVLIGLLDVPAKTMPGDEVVIDYLITNRGDSSLGDLTARLILPEGFQLANASSVNVIDGRTITVPLSLLAPGASSTVSIKGSFVAGTSGEAHVIAETGHVNKEGVFQASQRSETSFTVLAGDLSLKLVANGTESDLAIEYGSTLHFALSYENTSSEELRDIELYLRLESVTSTRWKASQPLVDWENYEAASGTRQGNVLIWTKKQVTKLARLRPRDTGTIEVALDALSSEQGASGLAFRATLEAVIGSVGDIRVEKKVKSTPLTLSYLTDARFKAEARYYSEEGAPIGMGYLPPVVRQETTYRVRWELNKKFHELKNLKAQATLPKIARLSRTVQAEAGELKYDEATGLVTWQLNRLPKEVDQAFVEFDVTITPHEADAGRFAKIMGETHFEATDAQVNQLIVQTMSELTTDLQNDEWAEGKGVVRKE